MDFETLDVRLDDRDVAYVTLNRPEKRNILSAQMIEDLMRIAGTLGADRAVRAVVLSGAGDVFCAGVT